MGGSADPYVRDVARRPVAISVPAWTRATCKRRALRSGPRSPTSTRADFYWRPELAAHYLEAARMPSPLPPRLGETGYRRRSPYDVLRGAPASQSAREAEQGYYLRSLVHGSPNRPASDRAVDPFDFAPEVIPADDPAVQGNAREYRFGLFRVSGAAKPAATELRTIFSGGQADGFNGGSRMPCATETVTRYPGCGGSGGR